MKNLIQKFKSSLKSSTKKTQGIDESICINENGEWFKPRMTREEAELFLNNKQIGVFVVRQSESQNNSLVLSVKVPRYLNINEVSHYIIQHSRISFKLKGFDKEFSDLKSLVTHCSVIRDMLPVLLCLDFYSSHLDQTNDKFTGLNKDNYMFYNSSTSSLVSMSSLNSFKSGFSL